MPRSHHHAYFCITYKNNVNIRNHFSSELQRKTTPQDWFVDFEKYLIANQLVIQNAREGYGLANSRSALKKDPAREEITYSYVNGRNTLLEKKRFLKIDSFTIVSG